VQQNTDEYQRYRPAIGQLKTVSRPLFALLVGNAECVVRDAESCPLQLGKKASKDAVIGKIANRENQLRCVGRQDEPNQPLVLDVFDSTVADVMSEIGLITEDKIVSIMAAFIKGWSCKQQQREHSQWLLSAGQHEVEAGNQESQDNRNIGDGPYTNRHCSTKSALFGNPHVGAS
jgi:hypothetical protein